MSPFRKIVCVVLLALAGSFIAGAIADRGFHRYWHPFLDKFDIAFKDTTHYDVVFLGNSTVHFGINPYYVDSVTGLKTFNLGYGGANIESITALFYGYLEMHAKPKAIVLSLEQSSLIDDYDYANYFLYFDYVQNKAIRSYLKDKGYHVGLVRALPFLKYAYLDEFNRACTFKGLYSSPLEENSTMYQGFINNKQNVFGAAAMDTSAVLNPLPDQKVVNLLSGLLNYCKQQDIKVLFVFPPRIYHTGNTYVAGKDHPDTLGINTAARYQLPYQRFDVPGLFNLNEFSDDIHLNTEGTRHYSICVGNYIDSVFHGIH